MNSAVIARTIEERLADRLMMEVGADRYARYFQGAVRLEHGEGGVVVVRVPSEFHKRWLERQFSEAVMAAARAELGTVEVTVRWTVDREGGVGEGDGVEESAAPTVVMEGGVVAGRERKERVAKARSGGVRHRMEDFVVGDCNRLAYSAAMRMAEGGAASYGVLFVHGVCGVGKTHLLQGLARMVRSKDPMTRVRYTTGERFANEYIASVQNRSIDAFRRRYRGVDLLCVDDVHFIAGKRGTQAEFLHTFATLDLEGARVVLASDEHPKQIHDLQESIVSRCVSGMVVGIDRPDRSTRRAIAERAARRRGLVVDESALEALSSLEVESVRDLESAVMHLEACVNLLPEMAVVHDGVVDGSLVRRVLGVRESHRPMRPFRVDDILQGCCDVLSVEMSELLGPSRHRRVVIARSLAAMLSRDLTTHSYPEIAKLMHRPNHSTIITACKRIKDQIEAGERVGGCGGMSEWTLREAYERIAERVRASR